MRRNVRIILHSWSEHYLPLFFTSRRCSSIKLIKENNQRCIGDHTQMASGFQHHKAIGILMAFGECHLSVNPLEQLALSLSLSLLLLCVDLTTPPGLSDRLSTVTVCIQAAPRRPNTTRWAPECTSPASEPAVSTCGGPERTTGRHERVCRRRL